jgi:hypothetical protein
MGQHPINGSYGAWLSKPGVDVLATVDPSQMLLAPNSKNEQIVAAGQVYVPAYGNGIVYHPVALTRRPYCFFKVSTSGNYIEYPHPQGLSDPLNNQFNAAGLRIYADRTVFPGTVFALVYHYMLFARSVF